MERELEVLKLSDLRRKTAAEIGKEIFLSPRSVEVGKYQAKPLKKKVG